MAEHRCSMILEFVDVDGEKTPLYCGKPARRKMVVADYDAGHWISGCCEECVEGLRMELTEEEIDKLYPVSAEAIASHPGITSWQRIMAAERKGDR